MAQASAAHAGRPPVTTRAAIEQVAFALFDRQGFERTTVEDIARAAGIGRRTVFRYFASKNDIVWGDWEIALAGMRRHLAAQAADAPLAEVLRDAVVAYNQLPAEEIPRHRKRMELVLHVPALQAHSTIRYNEWRQVVAEYVAARRGENPTALSPQLIAYAALGAAVTAYEQWLTDEGADLAALLHRALTELACWAQDEIS